MDRIDRKILAELQADGRLSVTELADKVGLSLSPCHRRVKTLEQKGVITGYRAILDPLSMGYGFSAIVFVTLSAANRPAVSEFEEAVKEISQIITAQRLFGDPDYMLQVVARDLKSFQIFYDEKLAVLPGVQRMNTTMVMKTIIQDRPLPFGSGPLG